MMDDFFCIKFNLVINEPTIEPKAMPRYALHGLVISMRVFLISGVQHQIARVLIRTLLQSFIYMLKILQTPKDKHR